MLDNKLINKLSSAYAKDNSTNDYSKECAFIVSQSVFCWLFRNYNIQPEIK